MSVSPSTLALNTPGLFVEKFGRIPTFDEAREIGMQFAALAAAINVGDYNLALNKGPAPEIPNDWKAAHDAFAANIEGTFTEETALAHFQLKN